MANETVKSYSNMVAVDRGWLNMICLALHRDATDRGMPVRDDMRKELDAASVELSTILEPYKERISHRDGIIETQKKIIEMMTDDLAKANERLEHIVKMLGENE